MTEGYGVVEIDLDRDPSWQDESAAIPAGVRVRVLIGDRRWVGLDDSSRIASLAHGAASVEIIGTHSPAIACLVRSVRDRQREWADVA